MQLTVLTMKTLSPIVLFLALGIASACTIKIPERDQAVVIPEGTIKPELDFSEESPDCATAAKRIEENVVVGMTLADVRRVVGEPRLVLPGVWTWNSDFSRKGRPAVRFALGSGFDDEPVSSFSFESSGC